MSTRHPDQSGPPAGGSGPRTRSGSGSGLHLGTIAGVPVFLQASWLILAVVLIVWYGPVAQRAMPSLSGPGGYLVAAVFAGLLLVSVLLHELGHALTARRHGIGVRAITLEFLGGYTEMDAPSPTARAELLIALAGPAVSGALGVSAAGVYQLVPGGGLTSQLAFQLSAANILVAIFNSLPGLPLDGGRALGAAVWAFSGDRHLGSRVAGWIGRAVAVACVLGSLYLSYLGVVSFFSVVVMLMVALTLWQGATAAIRYAALATRLPQVDLRQLARPLFPVLAGVPLAETARRAHESGADAHAWAVVDTAGRMIAIVDERAAAAVPVERRPWVPVESVARTLDPGHTLAVDLTGEDLLAAVRAHHGADHVVVSGEQVVGVLRTADLARALGASGPRRA